MPTAFTPARSSASSRSACTERGHGHPPRPCARVQSIEHSSISTTTVLPDGLGSTGRNFTTLSNRLSSAASRLRAWVQSQPSQPSAATASSG